MNKFSDNLSLLPVPKHVAIIMDGNGRWAQKRGLPRTDGHKAGAQNLIDLAGGAWALGIQTLTLYAFSTENWKRPISEVTALMNLFGSFLDEHLHSFNEKNIRLRICGDLEKLPSFLRKKFTNAIEQTAQHTAGTVVLAVNYGGRGELTEACKKIVRAGIKPEKITEKTLSENLYLPDIPDPEILIRTAGDMRISNFLLWQCAYSEFFFVPTLFPDFNREELGKVIEAYRRRDRRFGGLSQTEHTS